MINILVELYIRGLVFGVGAGTGIVAIVLIANLFA